FRKKILESQMMSPKTTTETHLEGLRRHESSVGFDKSLDNPWRGAEAFHFFMLAQRQLYEENLHDALNTSCRLMEYDDILDKKEVYSLIALTAFYVGNYQMCSKAFSKLESLESISSQEREAYKNLAISIFVKHPPKSGIKSPEHKCPNCSGTIHEW